MRTACVILAAGEGTRMKSSLPKVLHTVCGTPMILAVLAVARKLGPERIIVVAGRHMEEIRKTVAAEDVSYALQEDPKGTGHALRSALAELRGFEGDIVVMNGDTPLLDGDTVRKFLRLHRRNGNSVSVLSFEAGVPDNYGRIARGPRGEVLCIVEEEDADECQKKISEVNSGVYALGSDALSLLGRIRMNSAKKEYYLTDIVAEASAVGKKTAAYCMGAEEDFMGVNTNEELLKASRLLKQDIVRKWSDRGVRFLEPVSVFMDSAVRVGGGTTIYPNVYMEGDTKIGRNVTIYPGVRIANSVIGDGAVIKDSTVIEDSRVRDGAAVGPFAHLRPGSDVGSGARVGNFVELKKAVLGRSSKASHLSYLGDAKIGKGVNIGAGTITCNYDGKRKHATIIGDGVFVGSDSQLVAPVRVGKGAYIGAGSTITKDVPPRALAVSRTDQKNIKGWAGKRQSKAR